MLTYAFQVLKQSTFEEIEAEEFDKIHNLFAAILSKGVARQLKQGLYREYTNKQESLAVMRGKLAINGTIKNRIQRKQELSCEFDELSENNLYNQILKTTMYYLVRNPQIDEERKMDLNKLLLFFDNVELLQPSSIQWSKLYYQRNNKNYEMLLNICFFILDGMLQTTEKGKYLVAGFSDEHMSRLYERFILEYYREHHSHLTEIKAAQIKWSLSDEHDESMVRFLPRMKTDIYLRHHDKILIIDAKYYGKTMQKQYDKLTLKSTNLYQIFAYVKNEDRDHSGKVSGLLLYAKTDEDVTPDFTFNLSGNQIGAKTLDLNVEFNVISTQLDKIVEYYLK